MQGFPNYPNPFSFSPATLPYLYWLIDWLIDWQVSDIDIDCNWLYWLYWLYDCIDYGAVHLDTAYFVQASQRLQKKSD